MSQPIYRDDHGTLRFKRNRIVSLLLDAPTKLTLNDLALMDFPQEDWDQFYQLIGYSLGGYDELSLVSSEAKERAWRRAQRVP